MKTLKVAILGVALLFVGSSSLLAHSHFSFNLGLFPFLTPCQPVYVAPPPPPPCYYYYPRPVVVTRPYCPCCHPHCHSEVIIHQYSNCPCQ